ncbi:AraC family transcriptional regulator [Pigmentiphaga sp. GD03639]|uniref:HTH araC/xylS-type domain-containing protein n=1 Tax=Pigmentiphaga daeguensis TaxID=414049 RepID=A0ABN1BV08_9BURK|nr:AraC family transcriptional regulator [Pigmentiphaga sp. GD03639]MDH2239233.1 AraC family transcriptional regulator [Pigmentiphaga sp. GD03639]
MGRHTYPYDVDAEPTLYNERSFLKREALERWAGFPLGYNLADGTLHNPARYRAHPSLACIATGWAEASMLCNGKPFQLKTDPGSIGLFAPHTEIERCWWHSANAERVVIELDMSELNPAMMLDDEVLDVPLDLNLQFYDGQLLQVMVAIAKEVEQGCPNGPLYAQSLCLGLALYLRRRFSSRPLSRTFDKGRLTSRQLRAIDEYIRETMGADITVDALAASTGLSKPHFMKLFRMTTGTSPYQYVLRARVEAAVVLMKNGEPLATVARKAGFSSQSHFSAVFAKYMGMPPKRYLSSVIDKSRRWSGEEDSDGGPASA